MPFSSSLKYCMNKLVCFHLSIFFKACVGSALSETLVPITPHSQHLIDFIPRRKLTSPCTATLWKWQPKPAQSLKWHMQSWMLPVKWWMSMVKLILMEKGRGGAEYRKFGAVQEYCDMACLLPHASKALVEISSGSHTHNETQSFLSRCVQVGESGTSQCKFLASSDFHTFYLFVVCMNLQNWK